MGQGCRRPRPTEPDPRPPGAGADVRRHRSARAVHGAVRVHLRLLDGDPGRWFVQGLRHRWPPHDERDDGVHGHRRRVEQRPVHGRHQPVPDAADGAQLDPRGADHVRPRRQRAVRVDRADHRVRHRVASRQRHRRRPARPGGGRGVRLRAQLVHVGDRPVGQRSRVGAGRRPDHPVPALVRVDLLRAQPGPAVLAAGDRGLEPDLGRGRCRPQPVREPEPGVGRVGLAGAASGDLRAAVQRRDHRDLRPDRHAACSGSAPRTDPPLRGGRPPAPSARHRIERLEGRPHPAGAAFVARPWSGRPDRASREVEPPESVAAEAEGVAGGIEHDPEPVGVAVGGLGHRLGRAGRQGDRHGLADVGHGELEVGHLRRTARAFGPHRRLVPGLGLHVDRGAAARIGEVRPMVAIVGAGGRVGAAGGDRPSEQSAVEADHGSEVVGTTVEADAAEAGGRARSDRRGPPLEPRRRQRSDGEQDHPLGRVADRRALALECQHAGERGERGVHGVDTPQRRVVDAVGVEHPPPERRLRVVLGPQVTGEEDRGRLREHLRGGAVHRAAEVARVALGDGVEHGEAGAHPAVERVVAGIHRRRVRTHADRTQRPLGGPAPPARGPRRRRVDAHDGGIELVGQTADVGRGRTPEHVDDTAAVVERDDVEPLAGLGHVDAEAPSGLSRPGRRGRRRSRRSGPRSAGSGRRRRSR